MTFRLFFSFYFLFFIIVACGSVSDDIINESFQERGFENATLAKWKYGADIAVSFTWDDANETQYRLIAPLFDKYGFKTTFFIQTNVLHDVRWNKMYIDGYRSAVLKGHEIGSHTFQHLNLKGTENIEQVRFQLKQSKEDIERYLGYTPISFCHPFNEFELRVDTLVDQYFLNSRFSSVKNVNRRKVFTLMKGQNVAVFEKQLNQLDGVYKDWMIYAGHGVDGCGYSPINSNDLDQWLSKINIYNRRDLWIVSFGEAAVYEWLYQHTILNVEDKLLKLDISAAVERLNQLGISDKILSIKIKGESESSFVGDGIIDIRKKGEFVIITIDLEKSTEIRMI